MKRGTPDHPKMLALARALSIPKAHAVGLMETLWHWVARFAPQGDIGKWSDEAIADGADWEGDASHFVGGLIASRWLDASEDYRLLVHDWHEHCDDATRKYLIRAKLPFLTADNGGQRRTTADNGGQRRTTADNGSLARARCQRQRQHQSQHQHQRHKARVCPPTTSVN